MLAQKLNWPFALPLLAEPLFASAGRSADANAVGGDAKRPASCSPGRRAPGTPAISPPTPAAGAKTAEVGAETAREGAKAALQALLDQDSLAAATTNTN